MNYSPIVDIIDYRRGVLAIIVAVLSTLFNYGDGVETMSDVVLWFVFFVVVTYVIFTVLSAISARIWERSVK